MKTLYDISWQVPEETYRADSALSYSNLAHYERGGYNSIPTLFERKDTPSLTFGSAVDSIITGGEEEFKERFFISDFPSVSDKIIKIVKILYDNNRDTYHSLEVIPTDTILGVCDAEAYQPSWKPSTRVNSIIDKGKQYYSLLYVAGDRTILDMDTYQRVIASVDSLKTSEATSMYFMNNTDYALNREYQLKFKESFNGVNYRCMADLLLTNHVNKTVYPVDLKTSGHAEWDFPESFIQWNYQIQARLYWRIIRANMNKDPFWKEYNLADYRFIVVNKFTLTPLVWEFSDTQKEGTLIYGKYHNIECRDPFDIGKELNIYLSSDNRTPLGINLVSENDLVNQLNLLK